MKYAKAILLGVVLVALVHIAIAFVPDRVMNKIYVFMAWALLIGILLVVYGTLVQNGWGINLKSVTCPRCNRGIPSVRKPRSLREVLWGGGTCMNCGCEMDKWGRQITTSR
jgi:hypothetical protein